MGLRIEKEKTEQQDGIADDKLAYPLPAME